MANYDDLLASVESWQLHPILERDIKLAFQYASTDPEGAVSKAGRAVERILQLFHQQQFEKPADAMMLEELRAKLGPHLPENIKHHLLPIQRFRNIGVHPRGFELSQSDVATVLHAMFCVVEWWASREAKPEAARVDVVGPRTASHSGVSGGSGSARVRQSPTIGRLLMLIVGVVMTIAAIAGLVALFSERGNEPEPELEPLAQPDFLGFERSPPNYAIKTNEPHYAIIPGEEATLKLLGRNLGTSLDEWFAIWCEDLQSEGLTDACLGTRDLADDGTSFSLTLTVPEPFAKKDLPLPRLSAGLNDRREPIDLRFRLRFLLVIYGNDSEFSSMIRTLWEKIKADDPHFAAEPVVVSIHQALADDLIRELKKSGRWDAARLSPYVYARARASLKGADNVEPIHMAVCGQTFDGRRLTSSYHSIAFTRAGALESLTDGKVPTEDALRDHLQAKLRRGESVKFYFGGINSTSGYVLPCLEWGDLTVNGAGGAVVAKAQPGSTEDVAREVMTVDVDELRIGFGFDAEVVRVMRERDHDDYQVLWQSSTVLPVGGLGVLASAVEIKRQALERHTRLLIEEYAAKDVSIDKRRLIQGFGICNPEQYRELLEYLSSSEHDANREICEVPSLKKQTIWVGAYEYPPFVEGAKLDRGLLFEFVELLNRQQSEFHFQLYATTPDGRHADFRDGDFDMLMFEAIEWGWSPEDMMASKPLIQGGEYYVALAKPGRSQEFFQDVASHRLALVEGYHYGITDLGADPNVIRSKFDVVFTDGPRESLAEVLAGRAEITILSRIWLDSSEVEQEKLLVSKKQDQYFDLGILVRRDHPITGTLEDLVDELNDNSEWHELRERYHLD
jgi:polar amino acid transport system substrate-binding protein